MRHFESCLNTESSRGRTELAPSDTDLAIISPVEKKIVHDPDGNFLQRSTPDRQPGDTLHSCFSLLRLLPPKNAIRRPSVSTLLVSRAWLVSMCATFVYANWNNCSRNQPLSCKYGMNFIGNILWTEASRSGKGNLGLWFQRHSKAPGIVECLLPKYSSRPVY